MLFKDWYGIARVLLVGTLGYVALVVILRVYGKRTLAKMTAFDFVITLALGSSFASLLLSRTVPLAEGVAAFVLLASLQFLIAWVSARWQGVHQAVNNRATLVFYRGAFLDDALSRERVTRSEVLEAIRSRGFRTIGEVGAVVLETTGDLSVLAAGPHEADVLADVRGPVKALPPAPGAR